MSADVELIFKVIAYGVPALMVLGGIALLLLGYPVNNGGMITGGWALVILGAIIYVIELVLAYLS
jgi:membrane-bound ClpP family serine protease